MSAEAESIDAMLAVVDDEGKLAFDGLQIERVEGGYAIETPDLERTVSSAADVHETLADAPEYVSNWRFWRDVGAEGTASRAFLRWLEGAPLEAESATGDRSNEPDTDAYASVRDRYEALAEGIDRTWGQLLITATLAEADEASLAEADEASPADENEPSPTKEKRTFGFGTRRYHVRHVDDAEAPLDDLERHDEPREAREIVTFDEKGRYRPLKTAPTLVDGWAFPDLAHEGVVETVGAFYPATIANWHRERRGALDVDHWHETAERQTGMYDVVEELPHEALEWVAEACCVDSQCLKRREWQYAADDRLAVDGGEGEFPCREPCSLVIAAARQWAILETETEHTWEFELTRSEKAQLEELIDAVAEDRIDEIREADVYDGANRYRARYLRAKRVDEEGNLCGVGSPAEE